MFGNESFYERVARLEKIQHFMGWGGLLFCLVSLFTIGESVTAARLFLLPGAEPHTVEVVNHEITHTKTKGGGTLESYILTVRGEEVGAVKQEFRVEKKLYEQAIADKKLTALRLPGDPTVMAPAQERDHYLRRIYSWALFAVIGVVLLGIWKALGHYIEHGLTRDQD